MKFKIEKIVMPLDLGEYHEAYAGKRMLVWVNPPKEKRNEREQMLRQWGRISTALSEAVVAANGAVAIETETQKLDALTSQMYDWLADAWNQHDDPDCAWPVEDIRLLNEADPSMYQWITRRTVQMMADFRADAKKK